MDRQGETEGETQRDTAGRRDRKRQSETQGERERERERERVALKRELYSRETDKGIAILYGSGSVERRRTLDVVLPAERFHGLQVPQIPACKRGAQYAISQSVKT